MAYSTRIRMNKQATGANANTWGSVLNTEVFSLADQAIAGYTSVSVDGRVYQFDPDLRRGNTFLYPLGGQLSEYAGAAGAQHAVRKPLQGCTERF